MVLKLPIGCSLSALIIAWSTSAWAQAGVSASEATAGEIIVTARKRAETSIEVPVALTAVGAAEIERRAINNLDVLSRVVPQLQIGDAAGSVQGGTISLRGISSGEGNPSADQNVSFNIDGVQIARATVRRMATMDIAQVEVLKGPQALFFGKNSPAGIISIRTADPTDKLEAKASLGYEFEAREIRGEGYISAPISDALGFRLAGYASHMRGWMENVAPQNPGFGPERRWLPHTREFAIRGTLKFDPSDHFTSRLKVSHGQMKDAGNSSTAELYFCPLGAPQTPSLGNDCKLSKTIARGDLGSRIVGLRDEPRGGAPYQNQKQWLASLENNIDVGEHLTLTSVTGYYDVRLKAEDNYTWTTDPTRVLGSFNDLHIKEFSQELRLASAFDGPLNFLVGGYYQNSKLRYNVVSYFNVANPAITRDNTSRQKGKAYSFFGQLLWDITPTLELSGGGRYSHERKSLKGYVNDVLQPITGTAVPSKSWENFSPEVTLSWRPSTHLTVFGGYKKGFLSGGFNTGSGRFDADRTFDQTLIRGFEGGIKALLLNGTLRTNLAVYTYKITDLQVSTIINIPELNTTNQVVTNAGGSRVKGLEFDFNWQSPVDGLSFHGAIAYNRARYTSFVTTCYPGQTRAAGCNLVPSADGQGTTGDPGVTPNLQSLAGRQLVRAPAWSGNVGANLEVPVGNGLNFGWSVDGSFSSSFWADAAAPPQGRQGAYWLLDSTIRIFMPEKGWELALIGRNLTDKLYYTRANAVPFSGFGTGTDGPGVLADEYGSVHRGRELMLRVTKSF